MQEDLGQIAKSLVARGLGILAADESSNTCQKRFDSVGIECTEETRREYRGLLLTTPGAQDYMSGVIFYDETFWQKTDQGQSFPELLKTKVYVGSSAGSMVLGKRLSTEAYEKIYNEQDTYGVNRYLELVDISIMPHLNSPHFPNRKETLMDVAGKHTGVIYGLQDDCAIVVNGDNTSTIGSQPLILNEK